MSLDDAVRPPRRLGGSAGREGIEPLCGITEIARAHDVVALEHRARFMAGHLPRDTFGHAGPDEVAHRGSRENNTRADQLSDVRPRAHLIMWDYSFSDGGIHG